MSQSPADKPLDPIAVALAFVHEMGRRAERFEQETARKLGAQLAKAFDDGFVLGRETGFRDARDTPPADKSTLS